MLIKTGDFIKVKHNPIKLSWADEMDEMVGQKFLITEMGKYSLTLIDNYGDHWSIYKNDFDIKIDLHIGAKVGFVSPAGNSADIENELHEINRKRCIIKGKNYGPTLINLKLVIMPLYFLFCCTSHYI